MKDNFNKLKEISNKVSVYYENVHSVLQMPDNSFQSCRTLDIHLTYNDIIKDSMVERNMKVLDIGFGLGDFDNYLSHTIKCDITAASYCNKEIEIAQKLYSNQKRESSLKFVKADFHFLKNYFSEKSYDMVMFLESFEHAYDKRKVLKDVYDILKIDGKLFLKFNFLIHHKKNRNKKVEDAIKNEEVNLLTYSHVTISELLKMATHIGFSPILVKQPSINTSDAALILKDGMERYNSLVDGVSYIAPDFSITRCYNILLTK